MVTTKDLMASAQERKYSEFETRAKELLNAKFMANAILQDSLSKLATAKGQVLEAFGKDDDDKDDKDSDKDDKDSDDSDKDDKDDKDSDKKKKKNPFEKNESEDEDEDEDEDDKDEDDD